MPRLQPSPTRLRNVRPTKNPRPTCAPAQIRSLWTRTGLVGPELFLQNLPGGGAGEGRCEDDGFGDLVVGDLAAEEVEQLGLVGAGVLAEDDDGAADLAPALVGHTDDGAVDDGGVPVESVLHLGRVDVLPAGD